MLISLIKGSKINNLILPSRVYGNYWVTDFEENNKEENLINIEARDNEWHLISNYDIAIMDNNRELTTVVLKDYGFYALKNKITNEYIILYASPVYDLTNKRFDITKINELTIGSDSSCFIKYSFSLISPQHAKISYQNNQFVIYDNQSKWGVYVNNKRINKSQILELGDIIFIMGLKIIIMKENNIPFIIINNPNNLVSYPTDVLANTILQTPTTQPLIENVEDSEATLYQEDDYFHKKPRFHSTINPLEVTIDPPPEKEKQDNKPLLLTIGPMLTMGMTSIVMVATSINNIQAGKSSWGAAMPSLVMAGAMLGTMLIWPLITKRYEKRKKIRDEKLRQQKYGDYVETKRQQILTTIQEQRHILLENNLPLSECQDIILKKKFNLWERKPEDEDFLTITLGTGTLPMSINIHYPEEHFSMNEDNLKEIVNKLGSEPKNLVDVPVTLNLHEKYIAALIGTPELNHQLIQKLILQLITFHSYDNLKIVLFTNSVNAHHWDYLKILPHNWNNNRTVRYFGTTNDEIKEICYQIEQDFSARNQKENVSWKSQISNPYYLIITDDFRMIRSYDFIQDVLKQKVNTGFGCVILNDKVSTLPSECQIFINVTNNNSELFENILNSHIQKFQIDFETPINMYQCAKALANIPIEIENDNDGQIPNRYGFLEMYGVGKIEQLNPLNRWNKSNPIQTLQSPVGIGKSGETITLDLHEKFHGPHGLIAGMTGSGKSEFIITYILSMAINYHPDEVQFILIDYKGGGLAGAFENNDTGVKLPHLVGTITNLDANEINRSLASIESELKRRQKAFNEARELSGESTIDIYKYQRLYREGVVKEPISHLFIVSDEFAELKSQQPDFMQQLISTARIGRSLGVHLILATQKPSGVVDNQIWSNTRFRVCLRVQEKSDSTEVIKCPDAAFLKQTGRFFLQVGYNEIFVLGQAAWAGANYIPTEKLRKQVDTSINFVDHVGFVIKTVDVEKKPETLISIGEELTNIVKYLNNIARDENIQIKPLWLERISDYINLDQLLKKYHYQKSTSLELIVGEYDIPSLQSQRLLTLPLSGNAIIYGVSGSGKENLITTLIYSAMRLYTVEELNFYILDFGSETLRIFKNCPLLGDTIFLDEMEKVNNLFKMIQSKIDARKSLFADYNGDFEFYLKNSGKKIPAIVVIVNNYEAYQESYDQYEETLTQLSREGSRYGIYFILTVNTPNGVRLKLRQNFSQEFVLQQNNENDYITILGNVKKKYPSKNYGRGIIKKDDIYEFQTAFVAPIEETTNFIKEQCQILKNEYLSFAEPIPMLPEIVTENEVKEGLNVPNSLVVGIEKESLDIATYDFGNYFASLIISQDITILLKLVTVLVNQLIYFNQKSIILINSENLVFHDIDKTKIRYYDNDFDTIFSQLKNAITSYYDTYQKSNYQRQILNKITPVTCVIVGIDALKNKLSQENKNEFSVIFEKGKDLGVFNFIIVDSIDKIKKVELDSWYKTVINNSQGIWVGSGITDQFTLKTTKVTKEMRDEIPDNFCYVVKHGKAILTKCLEKFKL